MLIFGLAYIILFGNFVELFAGNAAFPKSGNSDVFTPRGTIAEVPGIGDGITENGQAESIEQALQILITKPSDKEIIAAIDLISKYPDLRAVDPLINILKSEPEIGSTKAHKAAQLLGQLGDRRAVQPLIEILLNAKGKTVWKAKEYVVLLGKLGDTRAVLPLMEVLSYIADQGERFTDNGVGYDIIDALAKLKDKRALPLLIQMLRTDRPGLIEQAIAALDVFRDPAAVPGLIEISSRPRYTMRAVMSLGHIGDPAALDYLERLLYRYEPKKYSYFIVTAIGEIRCEQSVDILLRYYASPSMPLSNEGVTIGALIDQKNIRVLKPVIKYAGINYGCRDSFQTHMIDHYLRRSFSIAELRSIIRECLRGPDKDTRLGAIALLAELGEAQDVSFLKGVAESDDTVAGAIAADSLYTLKTGEYFEVTRYYSRCRRQ